MPAASSSNPSDPAARRTTPRRWSWWKRILATLGVLLLLLVIFHRPIIFGLARFAIHKLGAGQGLDVDLKLGGTIFTGLTIDDLRATPTKPGPIAKANVGHLEVHYSLPTLIRGGLDSPFLGDVVLHDADVVYDPSKSAPSPPKKKEAFTLPPLPLPRSLNVRNANFQMLPAPEPIAKAKAAQAAASSAVPAPVAPVVAGTTQATVDQGLVIKGLNLDLNPDHDGELRLAEARIPGGPDLRDVTGKTSYHDRNLQFTDLVLAPEIKFRHLGLDASKLDSQQSVVISLDGELFRGTADASILLKGTKAPPTASVRLDLANLSLGSLRDFLKLDLPLEGTLKTLAVRFDGNTDQPNSWVGHIDTKIDHPSFGKNAVDAVNVRLGLRGSAAELEQAEVVAGENRVTLGAKIDLPAKMVDLVRANGKGNLKITVPDFGKLPVALPVPLAGSLNANGDFTLAEGTFKLNPLKGHVESFAAPQQHASVANLDFAVDASQVLPADATAPPATPNAPPTPPKPFWQGLTTRLTVTTDGLVYGDYKIDAVNLTVRTDQPDVRVETLQVTRAGNNLTVTAEYRLPADFADWQKNPLSVQLNLDAPDVSQFSADQAAAPLQGSASAKGNVTLQDGNYAGGFNLEARNLQAKGAKIASVDVQIGIADNQATVNTAHIVLDPINTIDLSGHAALQSPYQYDAGINVNLTDLARFNPILVANNVADPKLGGSLQIEGKSTGHTATAPNANDQNYSGSLTVTGRALEAKGARIDSVDTTVVVENNQAVIRTGEVRLNPKSALTFGGQAGLQTPYPYQGNVKLDLPDLSSFQPLLAANGINEKVAGSFVVSAQASGHLDTAPGANDQTVDGTVDIVGRDIQAHGAKLQSIDGHIVANKDQATIQTFVIRYDDKNTIDLAGQASTRAPYGYQGKLNVNLQDLKSFEPILRAAQAAAPGVKVTKAGVTVNTDAKDRTVVAGGQSQAVLAPAAAGGAPKVVPSGSGPAARRAAALAALAKEKKASNTPAETKLAGALEVHWEGKGNFAKDEAGPQYSGAAQVAIRQVEFNAIGPVQGDIAGTYAQQDIDFPTLVVSSNGLEFRATIRLKDQLARVDNISLKQGSLLLLAGYIQVPVDLQKASAPGGPIPDVDKIDVNIASKPLSIPTLYASIDKTNPSPVQGTVELGINAHGSLSKIVALVKVQARGLRSPNLTTIRPADADVNLSLHDNKLELDTSVRQPQIAPLTVKGFVPLDLNALAEKKTLDPNLPVNLTITLPRSSLGFLGGASKAIRFVQGTVAIDVRVTGTVGKPTLNGSADLDIPAARAENITVPAIRDFRARLAFTDKYLRFEQFNGEIGGGKFTLAGQVDFVKLTEPTFSLSITAKDVLGYRDDNATARVNADVKISGPLASATVSGYVGLTKSRYLKDIDIVPLNLPGKPAPAPPDVGGASESIGINTPPLSDWKFDLAIRTDDPFLVRGNLANGQAVVDLHLRGTGAKPLLDGNVTINNFVASLPFSRLEINNGNILFTPDQPLNPSLNLTGTSEIRNYLVSVIITGRARSPKITFTSEPPLAQEQIVSLLATGATTDELAGNTQALAGKATLLVLEDLYRRTFKKKNTSANAEPRSTLSDRVNFDVGNVDPVTGKQDLSARFKITDAVQFLVDFGIEGDLRGRVKYLIRFR